MTRVIRLQNRTDIDGKPDMEKVTAFIAMGNQGIVYEANRWHSPMCAIDQVHSIPSWLIQTVEFAVVQNENGVPEEDCVEYPLNDKDKVDIILDEVKTKL
jgi:ureidoglycolate hydrolase